MKYSYIDKKFEFSTESAKLHEALNRRMHGWDDREETWTGPKFDGKTPFLDVFEEMPDSPYVITLAHAIVRSWLTSEITVLPYEVVVGNNRPVRRLMEHFSWGITDYDDPLVYGDHDYSAEALESANRRIEALRDRLWPATRQLIYDEADRLLSKDVYKKGWCAGLGDAGGYQGHTVPSYPSLLRLGFDKTLEKIDLYDANTNDSEKHELFEAMRVIVRGLSAFAELHADKAAALAESETDEVLKSRYLLVSKTCRKIAHEKPESFIEAAQLMWFYSLWDWVDCLGRIDQTLYPFYNSSSDSEISREDVAVGLLLKLREHGSHNITLGGVLPDNGKDAANELTYLFLQILRTFHGVHPRCSLRLHKDTPDELMDLLVKMWSEGMSDPTIVSDTLAIDALRAYGVTTEDARDYSMLGCQEIEIPGKSNFGCEDGVINLAKILEYTLNDGYDKKLGIRVGLSTGKLTDYKSVEEIWEAFEKQTKEINKSFVKICDAGQTIRAKNFAKLVKSVYTDDCIMKGKSLDDGGAVYNYGVVETAGLAVTADAFAALETVVFGEGKVTLQELSDALDANFEGYDEIRAVMLSAPKFGNDDDRVDKWAARILEMFWGDLGNYRSIRGGAYMGACSLQGGGRGFGYETWALPDGHRRGDPMGNTIGPRPGADKKGLTAMLKSIMKLPLHLGVGGTTVNTCIPVNTNSSDEQRDKIKSIVRAYVAGGGLQAQITTATLEDLLDAKVNPEAHQDLIVRVGGFSQQFIYLVPESQDEMISRYYNT